MKYLKKIDEMWVQTSSGKDIKYNTDININTSDRKDELTNLINRHLFYLKNEHIDIKIFKLNIKRDKKSGFKVLFNKRYTAESELKKNWDERETDIYFKWNDIKQPFITFCEVLVEKSFKISELYFFDNDPSRNKCLIFTYDDIINNKIGDIELYNIYLYVE